MKDLFPARFINSIYFDTDHLNLFSDSEEGVLPRKKIRVRWYSNEIKLKKETKISSIEGRYKLSDNFISPDFLKTLKGSIIDNNYGLLRPTLMVRYSREYFTFKELRITFDTNIRYSDLRSKISKPVYDEECVMEIKTSSEISDDYIEKIVQHPTARFSKYSRGMLRFQIHK